MKAKTISLSKKNLKNIKNLYNEEDYYWTDPIMGEGPLVHLYDTIGFVGYMSSCFEELRTALNFYIKTKIKL